MHKDQTLHVLRERVLISGPTFVAYFLAQCLEWDNVS